MLEKRNVNINFALGLDTKTDPKQVSIGKFLSMKNSVFTTANRLTKRNGNQQILSNATATYLTTLNDNLTAIGSSVYAYNTANMTTIQKGVYAPMEVDTLSLIRNNLNQTQADSVVAANGLVCLAYSDTNGATAHYRYAIINSLTGQNVVAPTLIPASGGGAITGSPKVFLLGNYFIVVFTNDISGSFHLQYIAISTSNPTNVTTPADLASAYTPNDSVAWDGVVVGADLYIAFNTASGGQSVHIVYLPMTSAAAGLTPSSPLILLGYTADMVSLCADTSSTNGSIFISWFHLSSTSGYMAAVSQAPNFSLTMIPVKVISTGSIANLASAAQNGVCTLFFEQEHAYVYDTAIATNYISAINVTPTGLPVSFHSVFANTDPTIVASSATGLVNGMHLVDRTTAGNILGGTTFTHSGTTLTLSAAAAGSSASSPGDVMMAQTVTLSSALGSPATVVRSVGLASKAFIIDGVIYFLAAYESSAASGAGFQPSYFLINGSTSTHAAPAAVAKLAYSNGGGYLTTGIANVTVSGNIAQVTYLFKDLVEAQAPGAIQSLGVPAPAVYSQTGINLATFTIGTENIGSVEIAGGLQLTGGFGWMYDGYLPVEENFFLWPDSVECTYRETPRTPTGTWSNGATSITVSSGTGIAPGMVITDTSNASYISAGTTVVSVNGTTVVISAPTTHSASGDTLSIHGSIVAKPDSSTNTNAYYYQALYEWSDNQGNRYRSAPSIPVAVTTVGSASTGSVTVNVPTLRLTYKIANPLKITVYRWSVANQVYYQVTSINAPVLNDTTVDYVTFVDVLADADIIGGEIIYTTGGVVEDVNSPASNIVTLFDTRAWKVSAEDKNLLWFSKQVIESTPVEWSDLLTYYVAPNIGTSQSTGPIRALSPMDDKLIIFKKDAIYFINGTGPDNTGNNSQYPASPYFVTSAVGCTNQASIVLMPNGLMFQTDKGIWILDRGLNTNYIGKDVERFNSSTVTSAVNVPATTQVRFTLDTGEVLVYDYFFGQWDTFEGQAAISSCLYQSRHTYLNNFGEVYQENPGVYLDGTNPVLMQFTTGPIYLAGISGYQRAVFLVLTGSYESPSKLVVDIAFNFGQFTQRYVITPDNATGVYGSDSLYGQTSPFGGVGRLLQWRIPLEMQQCQSFQISCQEVYDSSVGEAAGAGFTLSNINCEILAKSGRRPFSAARTQG